MEVIQTWVLLNATLSPLTWAVWLISSLVSFPVCPPAVSVMNRISDVLPTFVVVVVESAWDRLAASDLTEERARPVASVAARS